LLLKNGAPAAKPNIRGDLPPSALLGRLQDFLPRMQHANAMLASQAPENTAMEQHRSVRSPLPHAACSACRLPRPLARFVTS
jgi:hypothetical protein